MAIQRDIWQLHKRKPAVMSCHNQHLLEPLHFDRFGWYISTCHQRPLPITATKINLKKYFADFERHNFVDLLVFSCSSCGEAKWSCKRVKRAPSTNRTHHGFFPRSWIQQSDSNNKVRANSNFMKYCCQVVHAPHVNMRFLTRRQVHF